jgi:hypothetical protein
MAFDAGHVCRLINHGQTNALLKCDYYLESLILCGCTERTVCIENFAEPEAMSYQAPWFNLACPYRFE